MSTIPRVAEHMHFVLNDVAHEAAKHSAFIKRHRKLDGAFFVQTLVFAWLANPHASAHERAQVAASLGVHISPHGLDKRMYDESAAQCLRLVIDAAIAQAITATVPAAVPILKRFCAVYVYDGSIVSLPEALREHVSQGWVAMGLMLGRRRLRSG